LSNKKLKSLAYRLDDSDSLRRLFSELNFDNCDKPIDKDNWNDDQKNLIQEARIIANKNNYDICYLKTNSKFLNSLKIVSSKIIKEKLGLCLVCLHHPNENKWIISGLSKRYTKSFSETRHIPIEINKDSDVQATFIDFLEKIIINTDSTAISIHSQISNAFDEFSLQIHDELTVNVFEAYKSLSEGIIIDENNELKLTDENLEKIRSPIFILLYRLIFVLYAESRNIFNTDNPTYYKKFSLEWIKKNWVLDSKSVTKLEEYEVQNKIKSLFHLIEVGSDASENTTKEFSMISYYGRLFDRDIHKELEKWKIPNKQILNAISFITRTKDNKGNYFFLDYSALKTRHLGSIYEHLLEFHLTIKNNKIANLPNPEERKTSASYYTPDKIVEYIVHESFEPIIKKIMEDEKDKNLQYEKILSLKILDPAMGSGHFLIVVVNYVAKILCEIKFGEITEQNLIEIKREVVKRCIYGVDLNPLAVDLASVALWLETISHDRPLSFLQSRLKNGDSLIGSKIEEIFDRQTTLMEAEKGKAHFKRSVKDFLIFDELDDDTDSAVKLKIQKYRKMRSQGTIYQDLKFLLDCKIGEDFDLKIPPIGDFRAKIGENSLDFYASDEWPKIKELSKKHKFFHWELEFPGIFYDEKGNKKKNGGFDIIIGNPPYLSLQEINNQKYKSTLQKKYSEIFSGQADILYFFFGLINKILKNGGNFGFITSRYFLEATHGEKLRHFLNQNSDLKNIIDFGSKIRIFRDASTNTCITILQNKEKISEKNQVNIVKVKDWEKSNEELLDFIQENNSNGIKDQSIEIHRVLQNTLLDFRWTLDDIDVISIKTKINENSKPLGSYEDEKGICKVFKSIESGLDSIKKDNQKIDVYRVTENTIKKKNLEKGILRPLIKNGMIRRYKINYDNEFLIFTNDDVQINNFPNVKNHLEEFKSDLEERYDFKKGNFEWWRLSNLRNISSIISKKDKLFVPMIAPENRFVYVNSDEFVCTADVYVVILEDIDFNLRYIQGVLNSNLMNLFVKINSKAVDGTAKSETGKKQRRFSYSAKNISNLPIKKCSKNKQDEIANLVIEIEGLYKKIDTSKNVEKIQNEIKLIDTKIDFLVNEIYQITDDDLKKLGM